MGAADAAAYHGREGKPPNFSILIGTSGSQAPSKPRAVTNPIFVLQQSRTVGHSSISPSHFSVELVSSWVEAEYVSCVKGKG